MKLLFLKRFLKTPIQIASVTPSSKVLNRMLFAEMPLESAQVYVEFGPGEGVHTFKLIDQMRKDAKLFVFELDASFCAYLKERTKDDPRVEILNVDAKKLRKILFERDLFGKVDVLFSGIPFSLMEKNQKTELMSEIAACLKPDGRFLIYQVTRELTRFTDQFFTIAAKSLCLWNIPPMWIINFRPRKDIPAAVRQ